MKYLCLLCEYLLCALFELSVCGILCLFFERIVIILLCVYVMCVIFVHKIVTRNVYFPSSHKLKTKQ